MSIKNYKGLIRGALALAISYYQVAEVKDPINIRAMVRTYLNDNGLNMSTYDHYDFVKAIVNEAENVVFSDFSMDKALYSLSSSLKIKL